MDWNEYLALLKVDGTMVVVGLPEKDVPVAAFSLTARRRRLAGSQIGGIRRDTGDAGFLQQTWDRLRH